VKKVEGKGRGKGGKGGEKLGGGTGGLMLLSVAKAKKGEDFTGS